MKRLTIRIAIAVCTFIIGIIATTVWLNQPAPKPAPKNAPDSTVYSVEFCNLVRESNRYDGKIVRIQAFHEQGTENSALSDSACAVRLRCECAAGAESCEQIWDHLTQVRLSNEAYRLRVDVIGRYIDDEVDPSQPQSGKHVRLFEVLELKGAEPADVRE